VDECKPLVTGAKTKVVLVYMPPPPYPPNYPNYPNYYPNNPSPRSPQSPYLYRGDVSPACRSYRTPLAQLLDASGAVAATAWSAGAALASSYLATPAAAAEAQEGCMCVEGYNPAPRSLSPFYTIATPGVDFSGYNEAAAVGIKLYFSPNRQNNVGVLDTVTRVFSTIATTGDAASGDYTYNGGAVQVEAMKPMLKAPGTKRLKL